MLDNKPVSHGWKTPKLNSQVERGLFWPLLALGPFGSGFKGRVKRQQGLGQGLQRRSEYAVLSSQHRAGQATDLLVPLFSTCTLSQAPSSGPGRPGPFSLSCPHPCLLLAAGILGAQNENKASHHTRLAVFQLTDTSSREADLISTLWKKTVVSHSGSPHHGTTSCFHGGVKVGRNSDQDQRQAHRCRLGWNNPSSCCGRSLVGESYGQAGGKAVTAQAGPGCSLRPEVTSFLWACFLICGFWKALPSC